jgi:putative hemolysin
MSDSGQGVTVAPDIVGGYPPMVSAIPGVHEESGHYALDFARTEADLRALQRLRFEVFNLELGEGLERSYDTGRDEDVYDRACHHLVVRDTRSGEFVGTYRMQSAEMAGPEGFYSADEFDLSALQAEFLPQAVELGRACIAAAHRNSRVLFLLWRGLAAYMAHNDKRYFFGCCSLTSQDMAEGIRVYRYLEDRGHIDPRWRATPRPDHQCAAGEADIGNHAGAKPPKLMRLYLQYGARIASPPAIDRQFKTIDYLAVFDLAGIDKRIRRMFLG